MSRCRVSTRPEVAGPGAVVASLTTRVGSRRAAPAQAPTSAEPSAGGSPAVAAADPELQAAQPMLDAQRRLSHLPRAGRLLVEQHRSAEGHHVFVYPFAGRLVHLGLANLLAWRLSQTQPNTVSISINDYGFELLAANPMDLAGLLDGRLLAGDEATLLHDVLASLNGSALAQRRFREIARVAGLVFSGYPGAPKSTRQLQASSSLFYEVFRQYDPANRLLGQAEGEVLAQELDVRRLADTLAKLRGLQVDDVALATPSPLALALMVERFREQFSTEQLADRLARIVADAEALLGPSAEQVAAAVGSASGGTARGAGAAGAGKGSDATGAALAAAAAAAGEGRALSKPAAARPRRPRRASPRP